MSELDRANDFQNAYRTDRKSKPKFHVAPPVGWLNDPNGFSTYGGKKHLFFQYHPYHFLWGPMHWGHFQTDDFVVWEELPVALAPDSYYDDYGCFSGSALVTDEGHVLVYTGVVAEIDRETGARKEIQNQCVAIGDGIHYHKIPQNPVIRGEQLPENFSKNHFRDPKVWEKDGVYYMVVGNLTEDGDGQILLFSSKDLRQWKYESVLANNHNGLYGKMWECPDFFELGGESVLLVSPQDMMAVEGKFYNGNHTIALVGEYDEKEKRLKERDIYMIDFGTEFYAPQTLLSEDGRRIMIAWMASWDNSAKPTKDLWNGMMTFPRELTMVDGRIRQWPVKELENYWGEPIVKKEVPIAGEVEIEGIKGRTVDLSVDFLGGDYDTFTIHFNQNGQFDTKFIVDKKKGKIEFDRTYSGIRRDVVCKREFSIPDTKKDLKLRMVLDLYSVELFVNDGECTFSAVTYTPIEADGIFFECDGEAVVNLEFHPIEVERKVTEGENDGRNES